MEKNFMKRKDSLEVKRILVGVAGGSASGKTTLCNNIKKEFHYDREFDVLLIGMDNYYKTVDRSLIDPKDYNFDHPDALDFDLMYDNLQDLLNGQCTNIPTYSFVTHERLKEQITLYPSDIIVIEGIFGLYDERIRNLMQYKIFMHCDDDIRLCRRLKRDLNERGRKIQDVLFQYNRFVKRSFDEYIKPTMNYADLIVPGSQNNSVAVSFIVQYLKQKSQSIGFYKQMIKKELVYFYDVIQPLENLIGGDFLQPNGSIKLEYKMTEEQEQNKIFFFFPNSDEIQREVKNLFNTFTEKFTIKKLQKTLKEYCKISFQLLKKVCELENTDLSQTEPQDLKDFVTKIDDIQFDENKNNIVVICIPFYQKSFEELLHKTLQKLQKLRPNQKVAILTLFSGVSQLTQLKDSENNGIKCVINCLCIGNKQKFTSTMIDNCEDQNAIEFLNPFFRSDLYHKRLIKSCKKLKKDLNKQ